MRNTLQGWILPAAIGLATLMVACQPQSQQPQAPPDTRAADEAAIREADVEWSNVAGAKDADKFVSFVSDDGALLPPNSKLLATKQEIRAWVSELMANDGFAVSWQPTSVEASRGGDLGYTVGTYELTVNDAKGKPMTDRGKYVTVWQKQADGSWKVAADSFNSDLPPQGAAH